jgi:hypothetical protein
MLVAKIIREVNLIFCQLTESYFLSNVNVRFQAIIFVKNVYQRLILREFVIFTMKLSVC